MKNSIALMVVSFLLSLGLLAGDYEQILDVAQYKGADWTNLVKIERNITVERAKEIADSDSSINFFFITKGFNFVLPTPSGVQRFGFGDVAFFSGKPWWGSAPGLADGYVKQ